MPFRDMSSVIMPATKAARWPQHLAQRGSAASGACPPSRPLTGPSRTLTGRRILTPGGGAAGWPRPDRERRAGRRETRRHPLVAPAPRRDRRACPQSWPPVPVIEFLRRHLGVDKVILLAESMGPPLPGYSASSRTGCGSRDSPASWRRCTRRPRPEATICSRHADRARPALNWDELKARQGSPPPLPNRRTMA
jgi:pimeloyl-ACP methyl ester carboxylesterase